MRLPKVLLTFCVTLLIVATFTATPAIGDDSSKDKPLPPIKPIARRIPPVGNDIGKANRERIQKRLDEVTKAFTNLSKQKLATLNKGELVSQSLADVDVYIKAVRFALMHDEFYAKGNSDVDKALRLLTTAEQRIRALAKNQHPWTTQRGRIVRGYYSDIDGSPQPYGLEIPEKLDLKKKVPLYVWLHGRGDKTTDMHFIAQREKGGCPISPFVDDGIIVHPFGRHCVGYKGPGEIDVLDVIQSVKERYNIDEDRVALLGFSMGGAGAWHIGAHYADQFCVVHAGAGFAETKEYIGLKKENYPPWYEQKLWGIYDVPNYTRNLFNTTVIAYSGENDKQIQAARVMERAFKTEGRTLQHIIGPGMGHKYHPESIKEIMTVVKAAVKKGRDRWPREVFIQARHPRYDKQFWIENCIAFDPLAETQLEAKLIGKNKVEIRTQNVKCFRMAKPWKTVPEGIEQMLISFNGSEYSAWPLEHFDRVGYGGKLEISLRVENEPKDFFNLFKHTGIDAIKKERRGPIDDSVMEPFLIVRPTGKSSNARVARWVEFELDHFIKRWRALYRGDPRIKDDTAVTRDDIAKYNLILWGDPSSNRLIRKYADALLVEWDDQSIHAMGERFDSSSHVPVLIRPNPDTDFSRYLTINAGITHREAHDRTNSLQNPKLPDWAIISLEKDPDAESPGVVKAAGFFDENWKVKANKQDVNER